MLTAPTGDKVVRYSPNFNTNFADDGATPYYQSGDMELDSADTTSQIYLPPFTLFPPELVDDFVIDWHLQCAVRCAALTDTPALNIWIRKLDTIYNYPVDVSGGQAPIAGSKHFDMLKIGVTLPAPNSISGIANLAEYGFMLHLRAHVHTQAAWKITDGGAGDNGYDRIYDPEEMTQSDGSMQRIYARYQITPGRFIRPALANDTTLSAPSVEQVFTHSFASRVTGGVRQDLFPRHGNTGGVNLWMMMQKTAGAGAIGVSSAVISSNPRILRPGMVAGQTAIPFVTEREIIR